MERPGGQPRRVRHRALRERVHRPGPAVAARLHGPATRWPAPGRLRPAGPRRAPAALGHPGRAGLRLGHRAHAGADAGRRGGRGPGRAGTGVPRGRCSLPTCPARPAAAEGATAWSRASGLGRHGELVGGGPEAGLHPGCSGDDEEGDNGKMEHRRLRRTQSHSPGSWLSAPIPRGVRRGGAPSAGDRTSGSTP